ncbi:2Fe-2S iron-sulfur cluster binding domain-containing protein [Ruaniaceae bacterium KH17]|nr:2Fe-2S iron-sulfur cluster binding domain-containing protein [Ruaniaceae bacterium KH17]
MSYMVDPAADGARPAQPDTVTFTLDGHPMAALEGQTIAGAILGSGHTAWRTTTAGEPRGVFCGIGVCFDCLVTVGDARDVRACMRRVCAGDEVRTQDDSGAGE